MDELDYSAKTNQKMANSGPWLHAWYDPLAGLKTVTGCVKLADLNGDGDSKLCICDFDKKLKVYKGTSLIVEYALLDVPVAMCAVYTELSSPRVPSIAVAAGPYVFIYRQLRPYRKWSCPSIEIAAAESDVWKALRSDTLDDKSAVKMLNDARDSGVQLSALSTELLSFDSDTAARMNFIRDMKNVPYQQLTLITTMDTLKKDSEDADALTLLVIGTEAGQILILPQDPSNSVFLCRVQLPSVPVLLCISGLFDVEWRISVTCRDGKLYNVRNGDVRGSAVLIGDSLDLGAQAVALVRQDKLLWVATMDKMVSCYTVRGKKMRSIVVPTEITEMCIIPVKKSKIGHLLLVALCDGEMRMYKEGSLVYTFNLEKPIKALRFGSYGREESTLVCVHGHGSLSIKIWKRSADVDAMIPNSGPPPEQDVPLQIPKKTKLYVEQTQREREHAPEIHRAFQRDLCKMRLETSRAYVKTLTDGQMGVSPIGSGPQDVRVQVQVLGLGPKFVLKISLQNGGSQPVIQARLLFSFDPDLYVMGHSLNSKQSLAVPLLLPGPKHLFEAEVLSVDPEGRAGQILLLLYSPSTDSASPMLTASIRMPVSELLTL